MSNHSQTIAIASLTAMLAAGPAFAESRAFNLGPFEKIDASAGIVVHVSRGDTQSVRAETKNRSAFNDLGLYVSNGTLTATTDYDFFDFVFDGGVLGAIFRDRPRIEVYVTLPQLLKIDAHSGANVDVKDLGGSSLRVSSSSGANVDLRQISYEAVSLSASSGADIEAAGTCISVRGNVSSGADIDARALECKDARANASSGGDLSFFASQSLEANASSGGQVDVVGNPQHIDVSTSSGGDVNIRR